MSARPIRIVGLEPIAAALLGQPASQPIKGSSLKRLVLTPIPWGKRDAELAKVICRHVVDANLPLVIPFNPKSDAGLRRTLRSLRIHH